MSFLIHGGKEGLNLIHVNFNVTVLASPKTTFENKKVLAVFRRKQNYFLIISTIRKIKSKADFTHLATKLTLKQKD